ncbi:VOC family protein [Glycomyces sp. NPDC048151]|uniref:VOC family protein n=1 Tax=Glycomyces sp. NPDC048151 TaxID=3364002 RepID=UPI003721F1AB
MTQIGSAFLPVSNPAVAVEWYSKVFGFKVVSSEAHAAVLESDEPVRKLTLLGPASGISAKPGLPWAPFNLVAEDLEALRERLGEDGDEVGQVSGDDQTCFWFTAADPDGNTLLIVDR